jgi:hypothetical protein
MQLPFTVKKNLKLQALFLFRYEEPRDILQAFRHTIPESNSLCVAASQPFRFRGLCFYFALLTISTIDIPAARSMQNGSFKLWPSSKFFFCLTRGPFLPPRRLWSKGSEVYHDRMLPIHHYSTYTVHCIRVGPTGGFLHCRRGRDQCKCRQYTFNLCVRERVRR